jgi:ferredoxin
LGFETERKATERVEDAVDRYTATTIPVHIDIRSQQVVLNLSEAETLLREAESIALGPCECRRNARHEGDAPSESCLALNQSADRAGELWEEFRPVTVEEALDVLHATHRAGLVHLAYRKPGESATLFCSCCTCCCWFLNALKRFDYHDAVVEASHVAQHGIDRCIGCGACVTRCPFEAWSPREDAKPRLDPGICFGCGLCVSTCPTDAISFVPRT